MTLLQDEGSSVAFPEVVGQARDDMQQVAERLSASKAGAVTQGFEQDIIAALEEMIDALQREQKRGDEQQPRMPPPGGSPSPEQALVDMLAELRMIRSMENRIYERTKRYSGLLEDAEDLAAERIGSLIEKRRYRIAHGDHVIELDVFEGELAGLVLGEIELSSADTQMALPDYFGAEVTDNPAYTNARLALNGLPKN